MILLESFKAPYLHHLFCVRVSENFNISYVLLMLVMVQFWDGNVQDSVVAISFDLRGVDVVRQCNY